MASRPFSSVDVALEVGGARMEVLHGSAEVGVGVRREAVGGIVGRRASPLLRWIMAIADHLGAQHVDCSWNCP